MNESLDFIGKYSDTYRHLVEAAAGLGEDALKWKEAADIWSVTEVLAHLADHHLIVSFRIRHILSGAEAPLPAFNQNRWVEGTAANEAQAEEFLSAFEALLVYNNGLFSRLKPEDWDKTGVTQKGAVVSLHAVLEGLIKHLNNHLQQIERIKLHYASLKQ
ncbi:DinB family protein [Paenibacillus sepulcri]|uniref:DinB family protein n=1 Tax=Paenibacillus sepulcri TaxID=359917 RepID=A0ABS7C200_9BACL|nr:DinB family protein [Paenibacillus sepulcri]